MSRMRKALEGDKMYINCVICGKFAIDEVCGDCRRALDNPRVFELQKLENDAFYGQVFLKLGMRLRSVMSDFCEEHKNLSHSEFDAAIQRMFLDKEKPKMWQTMMDMLVAANNKAKDKINEKNN